MSDKRPALDEVERVDDNDTTPVYMGGKDYACNLCVLGFLHTTARHEKSAGKGKEKNEFEI